MELNDGEGSVPACLGLGVQRPVKSQASHPGPLVVVPPTKGGSGVRLRRAAL